MSARLGVLAPVVWLVAMMFAGACGGTGASKAPTPVVRPVAEGEVLGKVDRGASGVTGEILTLVGLSCDNGKLIIRMGPRTVTGAMDCKDLPPQAVIERVLSNQVTVTYAGGRVSVETANGEKVDVPASDVTITESDATPRA
jgi:hypothetical protein